MPNINVYLNEERFHKFKELKFLLKSNTNEEAVTKIIDWVYDQIKEKGDKLEIWKMVNKEFENLVIESLQLFLSSVIFSENPEAKDLVMRLKSFSRASKL